jgi:AcrR family transcriptional regulator
MTDAAARAARPDRRTQRTQRLLSDALVALLQEKSYESITVQDIIARADIGRSTFYAHYQDKDDLLLSSVARVFDELIQHTPPGDECDGPLLATTELFRHVQEHYPLYKALKWGRGIEWLFRRGQTYLSQTIEARFNSRPDSPDHVLPLPVLANYIAGSLFALLAWWLENNMPYPPERMDEFFRQLVMPGAWNALNTRRD